MSLQSNAIREHQCDFPGCSERYDTTPRAVNAIVKDGENMAFCAKHSRRLLEDGVKLRPLDEIHAEANKRKEEQEAAERKAQAERIERDFIDSLK